MQIRGVAIFLCASLKSDFLGPYDGNFVIQVQLAFSSTDFHFGLMLRWAFSLAQVRNN